MQPATGFSSRAETDASLPALQLKWRGLHVVAKLRTIIKPWFRSASIISRKSHTVARLRSFLGGIGSWLAGIWAAVLNFRPMPAPLQFGKTTLLPGWEELTRSAGVRIWEWDVVNNTMQFSGNLAEIYGAEIAAAGSNADSTMLSPNTTIG